MFSSATPMPAVSRTTSATEQLNGVTFTGAQVAAALEVLGLLPPPRRGDPHAQAQLLQAYARDAGFADDLLAGAALHARVTALAKWTASLDPEHQSDPGAVLEAAARHPLVDGEKGIGFEGAAFQELVLFIEELPW